MARTYSFAELISPISPEVFEQEYREKKPLLVKRDDKNYYTDVLSRAAIDRVITTMHPKYPDLFLTNAHREVKPTEYTYPSGLIDAGRLYSQFADGGTIVFSNLELYLASLSDLCRSLERDMSARFQANIYLTPGGQSQGFNRHWDSHDVFVVQVEGSKRWRVYDTPVVLPLRGEGYDPRDAPASAAPDAEPSMEFVLEAGDVFYLPRGIMHDAVSTDSHSLHITIGMFGVSWAEVLLEAVAKVGVKHESLRRSLPAAYAQPGFDRAATREEFKKLVALVMDELDFDAALDHFSNDLVSSRHSLLKGQLDQIMRLPELAPDSIVGARPNLLYTIRKDDEHLYLSCYGGQIRLPADAATSVEYALNTERFTISDMPGEYDDAGHVVMIERLIREGLVHQLD